MEFRILGSLQVYDAGREVAIGGRKQRALLARLLVDANRPVSEDLLIEALWPEHVPAHAAKNLHVLVSRLRKALGAERIAREGKGYAIRVDDGELDFTRFERLRDAGSFAEALMLWRGAPLDDFAYDDWARAEIGRLEELRLAALEQRIEADLEDGRHAELVGELRALVAHHPLREGLRRHLIVALYRAERQAEALGAYRDARRMLDEELGLEPSTALRELEGAVLRHDPSLDRPSFRPQAPVHQSRRRAVFAGAVAITAGFAAAIAAIELLGGSERQRVAAATEPTTTKGARDRRVPTATTRVVVIRERVRTTPAAKLQQPPPPPRPPAVAVAPPPPPPPPPPQAPRPAPPSQLVARAPRPQPKPRPKQLPTATPKPKPAAMPLRITDDFEDGIIDRALWYRSASNGMTAEETNGRLEITIAPTATGEGDYDLIAATYGTTCRYLGDFDARVEFQLLEWPNANGAAVQLAAWFNTYNVGVIRQSQSWAEEYASWMTPQNRSSPSSDIRGALRISRSGDRITTYYRRARDWYPLQSASGFVGAPIIGLQAMSKDEWFADHPVRIAFDDFSLVAGERAC